MRLLPACPAALAPAIAIERLDAFAVLLAHHQLDEADATHGEDEADSAAHGPLQTLVFAAARIRNHDVARADRGHVFHLSDERLFVDDVDDDLNRHTVRFPFVASTTWRRLDGDIEHYAPQPQ